MKFQASEYSIKVKPILLFLITTICYTYVIRELNISEPIVCFPLAIAFLIMALNLSNIKLSIKSKVLVAVFSYIYGIVISLSKLIVFVGDVDYHNTYMNVITSHVFIQALPMSILAYIFLNNLHSFVMTHTINITSKKELTAKQLRITWLICTAIIMVCWLPHLLFYYPGVIIGDSLSSIAQAVGTQPLGNHFPVVYTLFIKLCFKITSLFSDNLNYGVFLYTITQYIIMAMSAGYIVVWLLSHGVKKELCVIIELFYSCCGIFAGYAISMWKDPLFGVACTIIGLLVADIIISKGTVLSSRKFIICWIMLGLFLMFWRNNGIYIFLPTFLITWLFYKKKHIIFLIANIAICALYFLITGPLYNALNISKDTTVESFAVPIQQVASVIVSDYELNDEQREVLFTILPEEDWENYSPTLVDRIKFQGNFNSEYFNKNIGKFIKVWAELLIPNFGLYVRSYLMNTMGFWRPGIQYGAGYFYSPGETTNEFGIYRTDLLQKITGHDFFEALDKSRLFICSGTLVWMMLTVIILIILKKSNLRLLLMLIPSLATWGTLLLATPIAFSFRYIFILGFNLPVCILLPFMSITNNDNDTEQLNLP